MINQSCLKLKSCYYHALPHNVILYSHRRADLFRDVEAECSDSDGGSDGSDLDESDSMNDFIVGDDDVEYESTEDSPSF